MCLISISERESKLCKQESQIIFWHLIVNRNKFCCNPVHAPEHLTVNQGVTGSSPVGGAKACIRLNVGFFRPLIGGLPPIRTREELQDKYSWNPFGSIVYCFRVVFFCHNSELSSITLTERRSFSSIAPKTSVHIWRLCALQSVEKCYILRNKGKYNLMVKFETG